MKQCKDCKNLYNKNSTCYNYEKEESISCEQFTCKDNGLTIKENIIMDNLVSAWNEFIKLDKQHPSELNDFCDAIHKAQQILGLRVLRNDYPEGWNKKYNKE
ncbi:hypothetical protein IR151_17265 [Clostridioides sp. ES-S-0006-03]|uniref:hypothetical protein n=1 Tax=Clostridioides sp. ES-S-0006-03 TaxID=2770775 RepID=UPI001D0C3B9F|nr:hypothetical protein [Clostridioides sp. ES-S-0006-03]